MLSDQLIIPWSSHLAVFTQAAGGTVTLHRAPGWLLAALGVEAAPVTIDAAAEPEQLLAPLALMAREILSTRLPVSDFFLELKTADDEMLGVLIQGKFEDNVATVLAGGPQRPGALLAIRDVTEIARLRQKTASIGAFHGIIGKSLPMLEVFHKVATYGPTEAPVIVTGETGTGKELIARALHDRSARARGPFVAVNCVALTSELFESELFGHEKGSFTGAVRQHKGRFQRADKGTLFLDEIGDMPLVTQAKMLRALEEGVVERIGSEKEEQVDVRVLAATNVGLEQAVQLRQFRSDLYHRLSVLRIHIPALRDRHGDIPLLVDFYLENFNRRYGKSIRRLTAEALRIFEEYYWPGNVRELRNVMERLVIETASDAITAKALSRWMEEREYVMPGRWDADSYHDSRQTIITTAEPTQEPPFPARPRPLPISQDPWGPEITFTPATRIDSSPPLNEHIGRVELNRELIEDAFRRSNGNVTGAARSLGVHKATLYRHMKQLGLSREDLRNS